MVKAINMTPVTCPYENKEEGEYQARRWQQESCPVPPERDKRSRIPWFGEEMSEKKMPGTGASVEQAWMSEQPDQDCLDENGRPAADFCDMLRNL